MSTVNMKSVGRLKVAVTDRAWVIETTQEPVPVQAPDHPAKVDPPFAIADSVTDVPDVLTVWATKAGTDRGLHRFNNPIGPALADRDPDSSA